MTEVVLEPLRLDIGSAGGRVAPEYTTVDLHDEAADVRADMGHLPYPDGSVDEIWASHCLEHVEWERTDEVLREWFRVLAPGRPAIIAVPNLDYVARYWLHGPDQNIAMQLLFGEPDRPGGQHRAGWGPRQFREALERAGFTVVKIDVIWETCDAAVGPYAHDCETLRAEVVKA